MWDIEYKINHDGYYYNFNKHPLKDATDIGYIDCYVFPEPNIINKYKTTYTHFHIMKC